MSKYTISVGKLKENNFDFGLQDYEIWDENYRSVLNKQIIDHYYIEEIGFETPQLFKHYLNEKMNLIMPKYNQMYKMIKGIIDNPLGQVNLTETLGRQVNNTGSSNSIDNSKSNSTANSENLFQDTPQGQIIHTSLHNQEWATNFTQQENTATTNSNSTSDNTSKANTLENYTKSILGTNGKKYTAEVYNDIISKLRNINQEIINELGDLFMGLF